LAGDQISSCTGGCLWEEDLARLQISLVTSNLREDIAGGLSTLLALNLHLLESRSPVTFPILNERGEDTSG
jgi:hypothetical protein